MLLARQAAPKRNQSLTDYARCASTVTATAERPSQSVISQDTDYVVDQGSKCLVLSVKMHRTHQQSGWFQYPSSLGAPRVEFGLNSTSKVLVRECLASSRATRRADLMSCLAGWVSNTRTSPPAFQYPGRDTSWTNATPTPKFQTAIQSRCVKRGLMRRVLRSICHVWAGCRKTQPKT